MRRLALEDVPRACRSAVVTMARARWKAKHTNITVRMMQMLRFIWMREDLSWDDRHRLHASTLGALLRESLVSVGADERRTLRVTRSGEHILDLDRKQSSAR